MRVNGDYGGCTDAENKDAVSLYEQLRDLFDLVKVDHLQGERLGATWKLFAASFALMVVILPLSILIPRLLTKDDFTRKIYTYGLAFSNFGFMGNSVVSAIFPDLFWQYLIFTLPLWILIYLWGVPALLMPGGEKGQSMGQRMKSFFNPMFIGMLIGMVIGGNGVETAVLSMESLNDAYEEVYDIRRDTEDYGGR